MIYSLDDLTTLAAHGRHQCRRCKQTKPICSFTARFTGQSQALGNTCNTCTSRVNYTQFHGNSGKARQIIAEAKQKPCAHCGQSFPSICMDFDHLPHFTKSFNISGNSQNKSPDAIRAEIAKCQVVCANCHRLITHSRPKKLKPRTYSISGICIPRTRPKSLPKPSKLNIRIMAGIDSQAPSVV